MTVSKQTLLRVYDKCAGCCFYCGYPFAPPGSNLRLPLEYDLVADYLTPRSRGGTDQRENLVMACVLCNSKKGTRTLEEFRLCCIERLRPVRELDGREYAYEILLAGFKDEQFAGEQT